MGHVLVRVQRNVLNLGNDINNIQTKKKHTDYSGVQYKAKYLKQTVSGAQV